MLGRDELAAAAAALDDETRAALDAAIENVRRFAERQRPASTITEIVRGVEIQRRWVPVARVGAYVPGGAAAYPSSLVMTVVPARVAGAASVVVASPAGPDGTVNAVLLGAAGLLGVDALVVAGGAQAIGALAYGLPDHGIEPVDLVVGPGNAWVTAAKLELAGRTAIDLPAGPSEGMVVAEPPADPLRVAADLITQAEHGPDSPAILVTTSPAFADAVEAEVRGLLATAPRREILARSLGDHGRVILVAGPRRRGRDRERLRPGAPLDRRRGCRGGRRGDPQRRIGLRRALGSRVRGRLRDRGEPRPPDRRPRSRLRRAGGRDVREVHPGPADHEGGPAHACGPRSGRWPTPRACRPRPGRRDPLPR